MQRSERHAIPMAPGFLAARERDVSAARDRLQDARGVASRPWEAEQCREELLDALERLASLVNRSGGALPYRLHTELELYRTLLHRT